jgi:hypothetical protein
MLGEMLSVATTFSISNEFGMKQYDVACIKVLA